MSWRALPDHAGATRLSVLMLVIALAVSGSGCVVVKKLVGADIDAAQFARAREARMMTVRREAAQRLVQRLANGDPLSNADCSFCLSQAMMNKVAAQYRGMTGWLDPATPYTIGDVQVAIHNGAAFATLALKARNADYNVDVDLAMDCVITLKTENNTLVMTLEPFNITPVVDAHGVLAATEEIIANIIKIKLATLNENFPPMALPVDFSGVLPMNAVNIDVREKVNAKVESPKREIRYSLKIREFQFFESLAFVSMNISALEVR